MLRYEEPWEYKLGMVMMYISYFVAVLAFVVSIYHFLTGNLVSGFMLILLGFLNLYLGYKGTKETREYRERMRING